MAKKLRDAWSRRKKATRPEDIGELDEEVDALGANFLHLVDAMARHVASHGEFVKALVNLLGPMDAPDGKRNMDKRVALIDRFTLATQAVAALNKAVPDHERRLRVLEKRLEDRGKRAPKKKRRRR